MADALCRLVTGGGIRKRMLYTDGDEFVIDAQRPVLITGLSALTEREDFLDRVVMVSLDRIEGNRKTEEQVQAEFATVHPRILGALFDGVSTALRRLPSTHVAELPRLADFALFATAASEQFGWEDHEFMGAYNAMRDEVFEEAAMANPLVKVVVDWLGTQQPAYPGFDGGPNELLKALGAYADSVPELASFVRSREWPRSPSVLVRKLRSLRSGLLQLGVELDVRRDNGNKSRVSVKRTSSFFIDPNAVELPF
jgi:hypothetical protein